MNTIIDPGKAGFRAGYASIFGRPNAGKSTLMNQILGKKISIISKRPQTTRHKILGIYSTQQSQIIFFDTPGMVEPKYQLQKAMMNAVNAAMTDADVLLFMVEAGHQLNPTDSEYLKLLTTANKPILVLINKTDLVTKQLLLPLIDQIAKEAHPDEIIPISALRKEGLETVVQEITKRLPESPPFYPEDMLTEHPERFIVSEIVREKIFQHFGEEVPYSTTVSIDTYREQEGRKDFIRAIIFTEKESQKAILIGKKGAALKRIGQIAREEIEHFLERPVYLELWVKVREKWRKKTSDVREFGYGSQIPRS